MTSLLKASGGTATISEDGKHRFSLTRDLEIGNDLAVLFVMLNPSTANALEDDPTITKCTGWADRWGFGKLKVANLYSTRATDPKDLMAAYKKDERFEEKAWLEAEQWIRILAEEATCCVCAWGAHDAPFKQYREYQVACLLRSHFGPDLECFGTNKDQTPKHPLYLPWSSELEDFVVR